MTSKPKIFYPMRILLVSIFLLVKGISGIPLLKSLSYSNPNLMQLRDEVSQNIERWRNHKPIFLKWRKYRIRKGDNFFKVMAKTNLNHETIASVNRLASYWDLKPGDVWIIPNMRGIARYGKKADLAKTFRTSIASIFPVPGQKGLYFIPGMRFEKLERKFLSGQAFIRPVSGRLSSNYGIRKDPFTKKSEFHRGIDIACPLGSKVKAAASGRVIFTGWKSGYGYTVILEHSAGYRTLYGHLKKILVKKGQKVKQGNVIALSGKSGKATGPHLHFEVLRKGRRIKPHFVG
ncbi:MAG: peptidase M23 [Candidatus Hydrogenedentota bacterium]|nr:MAG: peptidase M23 [Candidatus Hydrogenedentota bacterium]